MPKRNYTQRKQQLFDRLTPDHLFERTSIFTTMQGGAEGPPYDPRTVQEIQRKFRLYFESWIRDEAEFFLLDIDK